MDQAHLDQLLDPQTISRAEALGLQARHIVEGYMAGEHKSPYRGLACPVICTPEELMGT